MPCPFWNANLCLTLSLGRCSLRLSLSVLPSAPSRRALPPFSFWLVSREAFLRYHRYPPVSILGRVHFGLSLIPDSENGQSFSLPAVPRRHQHGVFLSVDLRAERSSMPFPCRLLSWPHFLNQDEADPLSFDRH